MSEAARIVTQIVFCLPGIVVCAMLMGRVRDEGGRVKTGMFGWPDVLLAFFICGFFALSTVAPGVAPAEPTAEVRLPTEKLLAINAIVFLGFIAVIWVSLAVRKARPSHALGFRGWPVWKALPIGAVIVVVIFPLLALVSQAVQTLLPQVVKEQDVVTMFRLTQQAGNERLLFMLAFVAVVFQPIVEEVLFRGYFYGVFKGWAGAAASTIFTCTLFAAIHMNVAALLPLLCLALALTLAYEWSGSLLVPIGMHMTFNGVQLALLMWAPHLLKQ